MNSLRTATSTAATAVLISGLVLGGSALSAQAASIVVNVQTGLTTALSDTRGAGSYNLLGTGLNITNNDTSAASNVAEYFPVGLPLATAGEPSLDYFNTLVAGITPGLRLVVDFNNDGSVDGTLVSQSVYGNDWWLTPTSAQFVRDAAPQTNAGFGSGFHGTLAQWRAAFGSAQITQAGFDAGEGAIVGGVINSVTVGANEYTFGGTQGGSTPVGSTTAAANSNASGTASGSTATASISASGSTSGTTATPSGTLAATGSTGSPWLLAGGLLALLGVAAVVIVAFRTPGRQF